MSDFDFDRGFDDAGQRSRIRSDYPRRAIASCVASL